MKTYTFNNTFDTKEPVCIRHQHTDTRMPEHTHEFIELVYVTSGSGTQCINDTEYSVKEGSCVIVTPGDVHSFWGNMEYYNILFLPEFLASDITGNAFPVFTLSIFSELQAGVSENSAPVRLCGSQKQKVEGILDSFYKEYSGTKNGRETAVSCYALLFLNEIYRHITSSGDEEFASELTVREILSYIDTHYNEKLTLSELSRRCYYHPKYFSRIFKKYYGISVSTYIMNRRLEQGKKLLESTTLTVDEIAGNIGYTDSVQFYRCFKKAFGISPGEYRKSKL